MRDVDQGTVLTIVGAKGGVGKTTLATNLAALFAAEADQSVVLIDLDTQFGDLAGFLDLDPRYTIVDLARAAGAELTAPLLRRALVAHESGAQVLAAPTRPQDWSAITPDAVHNIVQLAAANFDFVILDTPGAFTDLVGVALDEADTVLLITSPERTSARNTSYLLDLLRSDERQATASHVIVNDTKRIAAMSADDLARIVDQPIFAEVPYDEQVSVGNALGQPLVQAKPRAPAARAFRDLASRLLPPADAARLQNRHRRWNPLRLLPRRAA